jgi:ATP-dependent DNA ligase
MESDSARLVCYAFDLLHLDGRDVARFPLTERKALLQQLVRISRPIKCGGSETTRRFVNDETLS